MHVRIEVMARQFVFQIQLSQYELILSTLHIVYKQYVQRHTVVISVNNTMSLSLYIFNIIRDNCSYLKLRQKGMYLCLYTDIPNLPVYHNPKCQFCQRKLLVT